MFRNLYLIKVLTIPTISFIFFKENLVVYGCSTKYRFLLCALLFISIRRKFFLYFILVTKSVKPAIVNPIDKKAALLYYRYPTQNNLGNNSLIWQLKGYKLSQL